MPTTITLKGIPDDAYAQLKGSAQANRRSLNNEVIACLEAVLLPRKAATPETVADARAVRDSLKPGAFKPEDLRLFKRAGRP